MVFASSHSQYKLEEAQLVPSYYSHAIVLQGRLVPRQPRAFRSVTAKLLLLEKLFSTQHYTCNHRTIVDELWNDNFPIAQHAICNCRAMVDKLWNNNFHISQHYIHHHGTIAMLNHHAIAFNRGQCISNDDAVLLSIRLCIPGCSIIFIASQNNLYAIA